MKTTEAFKQTIRAYLEERGSKDPLFAKIVTKPGKNMDDCITCILNTVKESGCNGFTDDEVYSMAIHYFDEDNIKVGQSMNCQVVVNHKIELTKEEIQKAREDAVKELSREFQAKMKAKQTSTTKELDKTKTAEQSLF
jgi:hypothetical protein